MWDDDYLKMNLKNLCESPRQALENLKRRLVQTRSSVSKNFKQSVLSNQSTKADLSRLHADIENKLEQSFRNSLQSVEELASENSSVKERAFYRLEETEQRLKQVEEFFYQNEELPLADYHEICDLLKNLEENVRFKALFVKDSPAARGLARFFQLTDREQQAKTQFQWVFVQDGTSEERLFEKTVENQLERGFHSNSSVYKLYMNGESSCFGVVYYESMKMIVYNPRSQFTVIRRLLR